jgi:hypothetical protein
MHRQGGEFRDPVTRATDARRRLSSARKSCRRSLSIGTRLRLPSARKTRRSRGGMTARAELHSNSTVAESFVSPRMEPRVMLPLARETSPGRVPQLGKSRPRSWAALFQVDSIFSFINLIRYEAASSSSDEDASLAAIRCGLRGHAPLKLAQLGLASSSCFSRSEFFFFDFCFVVSRALKRRRLRRAPWVASRPGGSDPPRGAWTGPEPAAPCRVGPLAKLSQFDARVSKPDCRMLLRYELQAPMLWGSPGPPPRGGGLRHPRWTDGVPSLYIVVTPKYF